MRREVVYVGLFLILGMSGFCLICLCVCVRVCVCVCTRVFINFVSYRFSGFVFISRGVVRVELIRCFSF